MSKVQDWLKTCLTKYPEFVHNEVTSTIYCSTCDINLKIKKCNIQSHLKSDRHNNRSGGPHSKHQFYYDLIIFLISCNIPWSTVNNTNFRNFFNKYLCCDCTKASLPDESLLRKVYLNVVYKNTIQSIREINMNNYLWVSVDETPDFMGKCVTNVVIRSLQKQFSQQFYLLGSKVLDKVNGEAVAKLIKNQFQFLFQESFQNNVNNVLLLCTDSAAYMLKAGRILKTTFPRMKHITCLAHGLHRVAEEVRDNFKNVDMLISNVKKIFLKSPERVRLFKEKYPSIPLPPEPIITRWGTWINAAVYYAQYYEQIRDIVSILANESLAIRTAKKCFRKRKLPQELHFIRDYYEVIASAIKQLECSTLSLTESFLILDTVRCYLNWSELLPVMRKFEAVLDRNPDYDNLREIAEKLTKPEQQTAYNEFYKFAPLTSSEVERSFSVHKWLYSDKRNRLLPENVEKLMTIYSYHYQKTNKMACAAVCTDVDFEEEIESVSI